MNLTVGGYIARGLKEHQELVFYMHTDQKVKQNTNLYLERQKTLSNHLKSFANIDTVLGHCEECEENSILVSVVSDYYRCTNCGADTRQHVNGKIRYMQLSEDDKQWLKRNHSSE